MRHRSHTPKTRERARSRSLTASERDASSRLRPSDWASIVDDVATAPPPSTLSDSERSRWKRTHRGIYHRMSTTPSLRWVVILLALACVFFLLMQIIRRRTPFCYSHRYLSPCSLMYASSLFCGFLSFLSVLRAAYLGYRLYSLNNQVGELNHLTNRQRRLLGLPESNDAPATPARLDDLNTHNTSSNRISTSASGSTPSSSAGRLAGIPRSPFMSPNAVAMTAGGAHIIQQKSSPYISPVRAGQSPLTPSATSAARLRDLGLQGSGDRYAVGDVLALEELARTGDPSNNTEADSVLPGVTGVLVGPGLMSGGIAGIMGSGFGMRQRTGGVRFHTYRPALRSDTGDGYGRGGGAGDAVSFESLESQLSITNEQLDKWSNNVRRFLSRHIQSYLLPSWSYNVKELSSPEHLTSREFIEREVPTLTVPLQGTFTLLEMMLRFRGDPRYNSTARRDPKTAQPLNLWEEKMALERFLDVSGEEHKMYVLDRLATLSSDDHLWRFAWDSGGEWKRHDWTPESGRPTDAKILLHYFVTIFDVCLGEKKSRSSAAAARAGTDRLFTSKYLTSDPESPHCSRGSGGTAICVASARPLHVQVIHDGTAYDLPSGRLNLFYAISLTLFTLKRFSSGQVDHLDVSTFIKSVLDGATPSSALTAGGGRSDRSGGSGVRGTGNSGSGRYGGIGGGDPYALEGLSLW